MEIKRKVLNKLTVGSIKGVVFIRTGQKPTDRGTWGQSVDTTLARVYHTYYPYP